MSADWEMVIGLEVHCELKTATKLFCGCRNSFGDEPNVNICPICLGLPGSLPVLNEQAVELAMRIGEALHCEIRPSEFARKNYFYPDQAKDYQISQYDMPLNTGGWLELPDGFRVGVTRAHMEEDTGKLTHVGASGRINAALHALVDYNRSGVPLVEIVSEPDIRTVAQARAYASELRGILKATGASDGRMEEGSMRVDANVSVRPAGTSAVRHPLRDQEPQLVALAGPGDRVRGGASDRPPRVRWLGGPGDAALGRVGRAYGVDALEGGGQRLPLLPRARSGTTGSGRGVAGAGPGGHGADALGPPCAAGGRAWADRPPTPRLDQIRAVVDLGLDGLVTAAAEAGSPASLALARAANEVAAQSEAGLSLNATTFVALLAMESGGQLSATQSKAVLAALLERGGGDPAAVAKEMGFEALGADTLSAVVDEVIAAHPDEWERFVGGEDKLMGMFTGEVMKATSGKANGKEVAAELRRRRG